MTDLISVDQFDQAVQRLVELVQATQTLALELHVLNARLESWETVYTAKDGKQHRSLKTTANVYSQGR